ncbi:F390 synthetase-related protein [Pseudomonas sp. LRF_L74]|uniref:F390 synthetase-related protein n=1 Tax=Pseudomonas sp. LRF_L74 TaxID=3369422 RepID=UPI003F6199EA
MLDRLIIAAHFIHARWLLRPRDRAQLQAHQQRHLARYLKRVLPRAARFADLPANAGLADLPTMDKARLMGDFSAHNTRGIQLEDALGVALRAESSRDFSPTLGDLAVGLSSGTSGQRGVFLVSAAERRRWAGILLARTLPDHLLPRLLLPWRAPLRIAFFLRANSKLYTTLNSRRIDFVFHDLIDGLSPALPRLQQQQPDVLVAPATVLRGLAQAVLDGQLTIRPAHIISVAEVLEDGDAAAVERAFGQRPAQIYQASEGFLGATCPAGTLHLNERHLYIEPEWLDAEQTRFSPVVTDFSRTTQTIVRYRLNDVLRVAGPCVCGNPERAIAAVEGRADDVLWMPALDSDELQPLYPDPLRRAVLMVGEALREYAIVQRGLTWHITLRVQGERESVERALAEAIASHCQHLGLHAPELVFGDWQAPPPTAKRRRLHVESRPCTS